MSEAKPPRVTVDSSHIPGGSENPLMFVDLNLHDSNGDIVCTVRGFKLMRRTNGGVWLGVPQRKKSDNEYIDVFEFGSKSQAEEARSLAHALYELNKAGGQGG